MTKETNQNEMKQENVVRPLVLQNGIFVAGHPRSGTSLACKLLESAGVHFPSDLAADKYNEDGYFELSYAKELEKELLEHAMTEPNILELNRVVKVLNEAKGLTGLKVVHIPSLFFYKHIAKNMRVVFIFRNPADVKSSMFRRGISQFKLDWFENNNALIAAHENMPKSIVISYDTLVEGKKDISKAFKKLGFTIKPEVIKRERRTQKNSNIVLTEGEIRLYKYLQKLEQQSWK
jgi:hypothetical protein